MMNKVVVCLPLSAMDNATQIREGLPEK